jgi:hypothetical protein
MARPTTPASVIGLLGLASLVGGVVLGVGTAPGMAQTVTFNFLLTPNTTGIELDTANDPTSGTITYNGGGVLSSTPPPTTGFADITGIEFVNPSTFSYSALNFPTTTDASIFSFSPFYFLGTCPICKGQPLEEQITIPDSQGNVLITTIDQVGSIVTPSGGPVPIRFGSTGSPGTISFSAQNFVAINQTVGNGSGFITFDFVPDATGVPGPLPILGASTAFAFSRRLRRRVAISQSAE